ncbi:MAG: hypothetical protein MZW92_05780 [Comamonadaceae bacterium]|nr:hypothetical protein [Comamonadaceae bacterium]
MRLARRWLKTAWASANDAGRAAGTLRARCAHGAPRTSRRWWPLATCTAELADAEGVNRLAKEAHATIKQNLHHHCLQGVRDAALIPTWP